MAAGICVSSHSFGIISVHKFIDVIIPKFFGNFIFQTIALKHFQKIEKPGPPLGLY